VVQLPAVELATSDPAEKPGTMPIEPRIRPLIDALNGTGLVQTFTSCEGHFEDDPQARCPARERATVGFFLLEGVEEGRLARLFGAVLAGHRLRGGTDVELTITKHYVAALDEADVPEVFFDFTIRPLDSGSSSDAKRRATDRCLAIVTRAVNTRTLVAPESAHARASADLASARRSRAA
jgi:hypothetical protein